MIITENHHHCYLKLQMRVQNYLILRHTSCWRKTLVNTLVISLIERFSRKKAKFLRLKCIAFCQYSRQRYSNLN
jgi:hypothetical protein